MSNPSVFELSKISIDNSIVCIEDNIGEAIHLHIGSFRVDVTVKEFMLIADKLEKVLDFLLKEKNINILEYDPYFIMNFSDYWLDILAIESKYVKISALKTRYIDKDEFINELKLSDSPYYKYYQKEKIDLEIYENIVDIFQTNKEKADLIYSNILSERTLKNTIIIDDDGFILNGEEEACSMLLIKGKEHQCKVKVFKLNKKINFGRKLKGKKW